MKTICQLVYNSTPVALYFFLLVAASQLQAQTVNQSVPGTVYVGQSTQFVYSGGCPSANITWRLEVNGSPDPDGSISPTGTNMANAIWTAPTTGTVVIAWCGSDPPQTGATSPFNVVNNPNTPPNSPIATGATNITTNSFTANWQSVTNATGYRLDVSESNTFSAFVPGYENLTVSGTSANVTSLPPLPVLYYRVRATNSYGVSPNSNVVPVPINDQNLIRIEQTLIEGITTESALNLASIDEKSTITNFLDGLGRPMQNVQKQGSPGQKDIVQPVVYDEFGNERFKYLPFTGETDGWYKPNDLIVDPVTHDYIGIALPFYSAGSDNKIEDDAKPYAETILESSPLNRVIKQGSPGLSWQPNGDKSGDSA